MRASCQLTLLLLLACAPLSTAAGPDVRIPRVEAQIQLDGRLDEELWSKAVRLELPHEVFPGDNSPATEGTSCLLAFDEENLYVAFDARDAHPTEIRAHLSDRDNAFRDDIVGIVLDPFLDGRRGFAFMVNPLGVQMDAAVSGVGGGGGYGSITGSPGDDYAWDAIWDSSGSIGANGYTTELVIPWTALRFPPGGGGGAWGLIAFRSHPRSLRRRMLSVPLDRNESCYLCQANRLRGLSGIRPGKGIDIIPTLTSSRRDARDEFPDSPLASAERDTDAGVSARWGITPSLSLNLAINPDFSQVEADALQLEINRRFALFFPEKRPFFLEGADFFETPARTIFSRSVADPSWGIKLTGKQGANGFGAYVAHDRVTNLIFPGNQGSDGTALGEGNDSLALRYKRDVGGSSFIGGFLTSRAGGEYSSRMAGVDGRFQLSPVDQVDFDAMFSTTDYGSTLVSLDEDGDGTLDFDLPRGEFDDSAWSLGYSRDARDWGWWLWHGERGPGFRADAGFLPQVDTKTSSTGLRHTLWGDESSRISRIELVANAYRTEDHGGRLTAERARISAQMLGPYQSLVFLRWRDGREYFDGAIYGQREWSLFSNIRPSGSLTASMNVNSGDAIDFANSRPARRLRLRPGLTWNIGRHLFVQFDHTYERLKVERRTLFEAHLSAARIIYQFNLRTFARAVIQRTAIDRDTSLYLDDVDARSRRLFVQYLLSYKVNPQTVIFAGYTDTRLGDDSVDLLRADRTFFFKLGYAWIL